MSTAIHWGWAMPPASRSPSWRASFPPPETRAAIGEDWYDSYDLQSAIGQLDNQFTIL